jgi:Holliday junction DNA helicase RuvA
VVVETAGGVGYEVVVPPGVMERLPPAGGEVTLATELVVREDGWALYGFLDESERRFFQRLTSVSGVGPKIGIALLSSLGVERGARALREKNIGLLSSVNGIGKKTAERAGVGERSKTSPEAPRSPCLLAPKRRSRRSTPRLRHRGGHGAKRCCRKKRGRAKPGSSVAPQILTR